ncbi:MAG: 16S rRNA (guanine(966)-N(2))-methyltransferase RsmD [Oscillospiraceae bacterium]|nr:16S rRNA (guanine(966)-N(2))-methyltransferase RsmD [Oscillospiraceae bacterium]
MRVISGSARGRVLKTPPGLDTRPTTDRVKQAMFNIIQFDVPGRRVLDLFGGTGQLAVEALSRGARSAVIVERSAAAVQVIQENLEMARLADRARVVREDAEVFLSRPPGPFDLIFLDPPYGTGLLERSLTQIAAIDILAECGIILCESPVDLQPPPLAAPYVLGKTYRYGKTQLTLYHKPPGTGREGAAPPCRTV